MKFKQNSQRVFHFRRSFGNKLFVSLALLSAFAGTAVAQDTEASAQQIAADAEKPIQPNPALSGKLTNYYGSGTVVRGVELPPPGEKFQALNDLALARLALQSGQSGLALEFVDGILADPNASSATRDTALLIGATADIERGRFTEAQKKLNLVKVESAAKQLRRAFVRIGFRDFTSAENLINTVAENRLSKEDEAWYLLARGLIEAKKFGDARASTPPEDFPEESSELGSVAEGYFRRAREHAENVAQLAQFEFVREFAATVLAGNVSDEKITELRNRAGESARWAKLLAVALASRGNFAGAREALDEAKDISSQDRAEFDLLRGILQNDPKSAVARQAYMSVIRRRPRQELQEIALAGLWEGIEEMSAIQGNTEQTILAANEIEFFFDELEAEERDRARSVENVKAGAVPDLELLARARIAALVGNNSLAERHASSLLERFPSSTLVPDALRIAVWAMIRKGEYRRAAPLLVQLRDMESDPAEKVRLSVRLAECYFESGDYRLAADVYAKTDGRVFGGSYSGYLIFQEIFSEICAGNLDHATQLLDEKLDEIEQDLGSTDSEEIRDWLMRADCALILALRRTSPARLAEATERCENLLERRNVLAPFRVYALWQRAMLAAEADNPDVLFESLNELTSDLGRFTDLELSEMSWDKQRLLANAALLKARGYALKGDEASERAQLELLRVQYPDSTAAVASYLAEGRSFADRKQPTAALRCYERVLELCEDNPEFSEYASRAYFEAAQQAAALGRPRDAVAFLDAVATKYPTSPLVFYARLQQADFFRTLNEFDSALAVYERLKTQYPDRQDLRRVELSRADCLLALAASARSATDAAKNQAARADLDSAIVAYERLSSLPDVPFDLMAEAGNKHGYATAQMGILFESASPEALEQRIAEAKKIHWRNVNDVFARASADGNDPTSVWGTRTGYWLARSLFAIGELCEQEGDIEGARKAYDRVEDWSSKGWIPGADYARSRKAALDGK